MRLVFLEVSQNCVNFGECLNVLKVMDENEKHGEGMGAEIAFSRVVRAGRRIYYIDVKSSRNGEYFLSVTESKKVGGEGEGPVSFQKHKIFVYKEDFDKFRDGVDEAIHFIEQRQGKAEQRREESDGEIKINVEF